MCNVSIQKIANDSPDFPQDLVHIAQVPGQIYVQSKNWRALTQQPRLAVVGSRRVSTYGKSVTHSLVGELVRAGVVIVSGLAYGVDSIAHHATLDNSGQTIAVLPSDLHHIYPSHHHMLAQRIIKQGGALVSEYDQGGIAYKSNFVARNRIVAGLAQAVLVTEASEKSGTLHTARFALEQGKDVLVVPGNITSPTSIGTNNLLKSGATPVTSVDDILHCLGITPSSPLTIRKSQDPHQQSILDLLGQGPQNGASLQLQSNLEITAYNQAMTMLEITGHIRPLGNNQWSLS